MSEELIEIEELPDKHSNVFVKKMMKLRIAI
jgi:hypothetical protein